MAHQVLPPVRGRCLIGVSPLPLADRSSCAAHPPPCSQPDSSGHPVVQPRAASRVASGHAGFFVVALDAQIHNVALPDIRDSLGAGLSGPQWVVTSYTLIFASLQLFAGTLADRFGSRGAYRVGMIIFVAASAICAPTPTLPVLIAARILQGTRAALITLASLTLIREALIDRAARGRAIAYCALGGSVAAAAGPVLGGAFTELDWRLIFLDNLPIGVAAFPIRARLAGSPRRIVPFDGAGQIAAVADLAGLTTASSRVPISATAARPFSPPSPSPWPAPSRACDAVNARTPADRPINGSRPNHQG
jgi:MFS family permease